MKYGKINKRLRAVAAILTVLLCTAAVPAAEYFTTDGGVPVIPVFANTGAADTAMGTPVQGAFIYSTSDGGIMYYDGSAWVSIESLAEGTAANNTLRWNGSNWVESAALTNDGTDIAATGDVAVNGGDLTTANTTATVFNTGATTVNIAGAGTTVEIGAATGTTSVNNNLTVDGNTTVGDASGDTVTANAAAWTFANDTAVTLSGGTDGLNFDSNTLSIDATNNHIGIGTAAPGVTLDINATDAVQLPAGTDAQRPTGAAGMIRYNSDDGAFEGYTTAWGPFGEDNIYSANGTLTGARTVTMGANNLNFTSSGGDFNVDSNTLVVDASANRVGVGTASPTSDMDVRGQSVFLNGTWSDPHGGVAYAIKAVGSGAAGSIAASGTAVFNDSVGIGDTTPDGKLEVRQTSAADIFNLYDGATNVFTVLDGGNVGISATNPVIPLAIEDDNTGLDGVANNLNVVNGGATTAEFRYVAAGNDMAVDTDTLFVDGSEDRVGIGTTAPGVALDISATDAVQLPAGTDAQRPTGTAGMIRYNSDDGVFEGYTTTSWLPFNIDDSNAGSGVLDLGSVRIMWGTFSNAWDSAVTVTMGDSFANTSYSVNAQCGAVGQAASVSLGITAVNQFTIDRADSASGTIPYHWVAIGLKP